MTGVLSDTQRAIVEAAAVAVERFTMAATTVEEVARLAGVSRATLYRHFPGGREEVFAGVVRHQVDEFLGELATAVADAPDVATLVARGLTQAHRQILDHRLLQRVLDTEPELLLPLLTVEDERIVADVTAFIEPWLAAEVDGDHASSADYIARLFVSFVGNPGSWNLDDPDEVAELVRSQFLPGVGVAT